MLSKKMAYMKVTFEEDEAGGSVWWHRLHGDGCYPESLQGDIAKIHAARNDQTREKPLEI